MVWRLVTCKDWPHIWLNGGFATYSEALYREHSTGYDDFQYYVLGNIAQVYFDEACKLYKRPIVTNKYKYPDELFDAHSYQKGGYVLHMLRNFLGNEIFKEGLKRYLEKYRYSNAESDDLRRILENTSGKDLQLFFNQWVYSAGHPEIDIELSQDKSFIKIIQARMKLSQDKQESKVYTLNVKAKKENTFQISEYGDVQELEWFSIDPHLKILIEIKSITAPTEMLMGQLQYGITAYEKIQAIRYLRLPPSASENTRSNVINALKKIILDDRLFWGISSEAATKLGAFQTHNSYNSLKECFNNGIQNPFIRRAVVSSIGSYIPRQPDALAILKAIVENGDKSYFVELEALAAIGYAKEEYSLEKLTQALEKTGTFIDIIPLGAIDGLRIFAYENKDEHVVESIASLFIKKSKYGNPNGIRESSTSALTDFILRDSNLNQQVYDELLNLLDDSWAHVRSAACDVFGTAFAYDVIKEKHIDQALIDQVISKLEQIARNDLDLLVRRHAELAIESIQKAPPVAIMLMAKEERAMHRKRVMTLRRMRMIDPVSNIIHRHVFKY